MRGFIKCVDKEYNIVYVKRDDPRFLNKEVVKILDKYRTVKDSLGNIHVIFNNDIRLQHEFQPVTAKHFCDCIIHGKQRIDDYKMKSRVKIPEKYKIYCRRCHEYYLSDQYIPTEQNKIDCIDALNNIHFSCSNQQTSKYFIKYMPQFLKIIEQFSIKEIDELKFSNKIFCLKNKIFEIPKCNLSSCSNKTRLLKSPGFGFSLFCDKHEKSMFSSKKENELYNFIKSIYSKEIKKNYRKIKNNEIDVFIPDLNIGFEFNGLYWHSEKYKDKNNHFNKYNLLKENGVRLITIWEDEWNFKRNIILSIIKNSLNLNETKIDARKCELKILNSEEKLLFLNNNHIQGNCSSFINLGLFNNNELVSIMTFGKKRMILNQKNIENEYELLRFCSKINTSVRGASSKLFKFFIQNYNPDKVLSYANLSIGEGNLYRILGFNLLGHTGINYWWSDFQHRYHRSGFMKHKLIKEGFDKNKTEAEIMKERGYNRIWGLGNNKWEWNKNIKIL